MAVRDGTPTARHIAAVSMEYSVQSPASVCATCDAGAIASEKFIAFMLRLTQPSISSDLRHGSVSAPTAVCACCLTRGSSLVRKKLLVVYSGPGVVAPARATAG